MVLYDNIDNAIKEKKQKLNNNHIRNLKIMNILNALVMTFLIIIDIFLLIKGIFTGMPSSVTALLIIFVVAQTGSLVVFSIKRFARASMVTKVGIVIICTLPIIPYIIYLSIGNNIYIACLIARIIGVIALAMLLFNAKTTNDKKTFGVKGIPLAIASLFALLVVIYILVSTTNRKVIYSYDPLYDGYVVSDVLSGKGEVNIDNNTVAISSKSLKNVSGNLVIPKNVRYIAEDAFVDSNITSLTIYSENIELMKAVNNSNIENIYLESTNATIDVDNLDKDIEIATNREVVDQYRETYRKYDYLFVPKLNSGEYYVCFNGTNLPVYIYKEEKEINEPQKDSLPKEIDGKKILFNGYYVSNKEINFPINVSSNTKIACEYSYIYNVTYDFSGCEDIYDLPTTYYNKIGDVELPELSKDGYQFKGWYDVDQYGNYTKEYKKLDRTLKNDINLKAKFLKEFTVTYDKVLSNATLDGNTKEIYTEEDVVELKNPTIDGFTFDGWYLDSKYNVKATTYLNSDTTLYAKWKINNIVTLSDDVNKVFDNTESNVNVSAVAELKDVTISYSFYDKDDNLIVNDNNFNVINAKDSNDYYAKITFNYKDIVIYEMKTDYINVTINKATYDMTDVVVSDEEYVYDGTFHTPSITGVLPTGIDNIQITYSFDEGIKNVGTKNVLCHFNTLSENYEIPSDIEGIVTITEREVTINWNSKLEFEYDGSMKFPEYTLKNVISSDIENLKCNSTGSANGIGEHTAKITSLVQDSGNVYKNYKLTSNQSNLSIQYTIVPRTNEIDGISVSDVEAVYDGKIHLPEVVKPSGIEAKYSIEPVNVGTYNVVVSFEYITNPNEKIGNIYNSTVTITRRELDINWYIDEEETNTTVYDGKSHVIDYEITNLVGNDKVELDYNTFDLLNAGNYSISFEISGDDKDNYILTNKEFKYTITPKEISFDLNDLGFNDTNYTYNGKNQYPSIDIDNPNLPKGVVVSYEGYGKEAKTYNVTANFSINSTNYKIADSSKSKTIKVVINPKVAEITWGQRTFVYDEKEHFPTATVGNLESGDTCNVVVTYREEYAMTPGTYTAVASELSNKNYILPNDESKTTTSFIIEEAEYAFTYEFNPLEVDYDGNFHMVEVEIDDMPNWLFINYKTSDGDEIIDGFKDAGTYVVLAEFKSNNPSYSVPSEPIQTTVTIKALEANISFTLENNTYTGEAIYPTAKVTNVVEGDNPIVILDRGKDNINVGNYVVKAIEISGNSNYKISNSVAYSYEIKKATYDTSNIQFVNKSFEYDGHVKNIFITAKDELLGTEIKGKDGVVVTISYSDGLIDVGTKLITATFTGSSNYNEIPQMTAYVTVAPKEVELRWGGSSFTYTGTVIKPECIISGTVLNDTCYCTVNASGINVGKHIATASNLTNSNYKLPQDNSYEYEITKATIDISGLSYNSTTKVYDSTDLYPEIVGTIPAGVDVTYEGLSSEVGVHTITIKFDAGENYNKIPSKEIDVEITKRQVSINWTDLEAPYTGVESYPSYELSNIIFGDICEVVFDEGGIEVGEHTINVLRLTNNNYELDKEYSVTYKIIKLDYDMSGIKFENVELEYNGQEQRPTISGTLPQGLSVSYSAGATNVSEGTKTVTATFTSSDDNYIAPKPMTATITILPKVLNVSWTNTTVDYDGKKHSPTATLSGFVGDDTATVTITDYGINADTYECGIASISNKNYSVTSTVTLTINKIDYDMSDVKFENVTFTYDGLEHQQEVTGLSSVIGIDGISLEINEYTGVAKNVSDSGVECTVSFKTSSPNYNVPNDMTCIINITPITVDLSIKLDTNSSVVASTQSWNNCYSISTTYDGLEHTVIIGYDSKNIVSGDNVSFSIDGTFKDYNSGNAHAFDIISNNSNYVSTYNKLNAYINQLNAGYWWNGITPGWWPSDVSSLPDVVLIYTHTSIDGLTYTDEIPTIYGSYTLRYESITENVKISNPQESTSTYDVSLTGDSLLALAHYYDSNNDGKITDYPELVNIESLYNQLGENIPEIEEIINTSYADYISDAEIIEFVKKDSTVVSTSDYCTNVSGNLKDNIDSKLYYGHKFETAIKMETATNITLNLEGTDFTYVILVTDAANKKIKINNYTTDSSGNYFATDDDGTMKLRFESTPNSLVITKNEKDVNLYGIILMK
ncbi:MAG: InlB B-repeat-containing protein [Acholeplasmatales bacterium]|nr:InlB B-repeat-containing protein [Acholeplasmatales bacterium]